MQAQPLRRRTSRPETLALHAAQRGRPAFGIALADVRRASLRKPGRRRRRAKLPQLPHVRVLALRARLNRVQ